MWLSLLISALLFGQLLAAASTGSSEHDLPRIRPRYPQFRGGLGPKGFPGGGFTTAPKAAGSGSGPAPKAPAVDQPVPKGTEPKSPKTPFNPFAAAPPKAAAPDPKASAQEPAPKDSPDPPKTPGNPLAEAIGGILGALGTAAGSLISSPLEILTTDEAVKCRQYPDTFTPDPTKLTIYAKPTKLTVTCWTRADGTGPGGKVQGSSIWLRTAGGCYISEMNTQTTQDFEVQLKACAPVQHFVGTMQTQYKRQDCYECTNTNCASKNIGSVAQVELSCTTIGEITAGNATWVKSATENCYFPGAIFQPRGWFGTGTGQCPTP